MRNLRLLLGISIFWLALSALSDGLNSLVLPKLLLDRAAGSASGDGAGSATLLGLLTFAGLAAAMLVQPVAGQWSDRLRGRWGRHAPIGLGLLLTLGALAALGLASQSAAGGWPALAAAYLAVQVAASIAQAPQQGLIPDLVAPPQRGLAAGWKGLMDTGGATLGFLLLGSLLAGTSIAPALLAVAALLVACYLLAVLLVRAGQPPPDVAITPSPAHPLPRSLPSAFHLDLRRHSAFARVVLARFCFLLGTYAVGRFLLLLIADRLALDPSRAAEETGLLLGVLTLLTALAAPLGGWAADRLGRVPLMALGCVLSAAGVLGLIGANSAPLILLCGVVMAFGSAAFGAANWALTTELAPQEEAARYMALANFGTAGGAAAAGLLGPLVDWGNRQADDYGYTLLLVAAALATLAAIPLLHRLPAPPTAAAQTDSTPHLENLA